MNELVLTEEQSRVLAAARGPVVVRDAAGAEVGTLDAFEADVIRRWKERKNGPPQPTYPAHVVRERMRLLLAEKERRGVMTQAEAVEFLDRLRGEPAP